MRIQIRHIYVAGCIYRGQAGSYTADDTRLSRNRHHGHPHFGIMIAAAQNHTA
jgi:hypothetical protein